jgi:hypothetical protein
MSLLASSLIMPRGILLFVELARTGRILSSAIFRAGCNVFCCSFRKCPKLALLQQSGELDKACRV